MEKKKYSIDLVDQIRANDELPPQKYIWGGITPGSLGFVYGPPKSGKTTFCENLGMCIAYGKSDFFGYKIENNDPQKVLFISMEEYWRARTERNKKQLSRMEVAEELKSNYMVVNENFPRVFLNNDDLKNRLQEIIDETKPNIVFIDSMTRMASKEIEDSSVCSAISLILRELANSNGVAIIVIHHTHKLNGNAISIDSLAGSRVLAQEADFMIGINRTVNGHRYYKEVAMRYGQEKEDIMLFEIDDNQWLFPFEEMAEHKVLELTDRRRKPEKIEEVISAIQDLYKQNVTVTKPIIVNKLKGKIEKSQTYLYLNKLELDGIIKMENMNITLIQ